MMTTKGKIRWGAIVNGVVGLAAVLGDPHMLAYLPAKVAAPVAALCVVIATFKKPALRTDAERQP